MTTTAEKIKEIEGHIGYLERSHKEAIDTLRNELVDLKNDIKHPDPEPLECWINVNGDGNRRTAFPAYVFHYTKEEAEMDAADITTRAAVHMREVTPQDELDRKDAARYRWLLENGYENTQVRWANMAEWSELIDKAIEGGDAE